MRKGLALILAVWLMFSLCGCSRFNGYGHGSVKYSGTLKTLANNNGTELSDFILTGDFEGWENKTSIYCNDCELVRGSVGMADIMSGVFYEKGLVEYNEDTTNGNYDRFREDFVFTIDFYNGKNHWFVSYADALQWIEENYS